MRAKNGSLISTQVALTADWQSPAIWLDSAIVYSLQITFSGTPDGDFSIEMSNDDLDYDDIYLSGKTITNWTTVGSTTITAPGSADDAGWNVTDCGYKWARLVYTYNTTNGFLDSARFQVKGA